MVLKKTYFDCFTLRSALAWLAKEFNSYTGWRTMLAVGPIEADDEEQTIHLWARFCNIAEIIDDLVELAAPGCSWSVVNNMIVVRKDK